MAKSKYDPSKGEFRMGGDEVLEYWEDGDRKLSGPEAKALLDRANAPQEDAAQIEAQRPSNILRNLNDEDAAKILNLAGISHSGN